MRFLLDTNVAIAVGTRDSDFEGLRTFLLSTNGRLLLGPPVIAELLVKVLNGQNRYFEKNKRPLTRLIALNPEIFELPESFARILFFGPNTFIVGVRPWHYRELLTVLEASNSKSDFIARAHAPAVQWNRIQNLPTIHNDQVSRELNDLRRLASQQPKRAFAEKVAESVSNGAITGVADGLSNGVLTVDPNKVSQAFSAAFEYLEANILKVKAGAKPEKNDRGVWVDYNILWYLADPEVTMITLEKFHRSITKSPQASRIIEPPWRNKRPPTRVST